LGYNEFYSKFNDYLWGENNVDLIDMDREILLEINEKLFYVGLNPDKEDRGYGCIDAEEFRIWLADKLNIPIKIKV
jgi:hypothetical protein